MSKKKKDKKLLLGIFEMYSEDEAFRVAFREAAARRRERRKDIDWQKKYENNQAIRAMEDHKYRRKARRDRIKAVQEYVDDRKVQRTLFVSTANYGVVDDKIIDKITKEEEDHD